ncbi:hypothetical protein DW1_1106 [Proteiniborus sp. DW1]|uniref:hypothetical protein n=1 Tax=Proteiniborus sp. DW1 TaxID=1889883 RepID=UPI00092DFB41|nr:hypothetical protein [Proteiniborus sp. DW1]SCG82679.1 hypothetical protein DW1_1106 [Proteiniborus sp. DW1]
MKKLDNIFKRKSFIHMCLVEDKRTNEIEIAKLREKIRNTDSKHETSYCLGQINTLIYENRKIKTRILIDLDVIQIEIPF